jgi:hypothetical protein
VSIVASKNATAHRRRRFVKHCKHRYVPVEDGWVCVAGCDERLTEAEFEARNN